MEGTHSLRDSNSRIKFQLCDKSKESDYNRIKRESDGAGILWFNRVNDAEVCLGGSPVDFRFFKFKEDSSFQNLKDFLGVILGIIGLVKLGFWNTDIEIRGDSISALTWAETKRYGGERVTNASMIFASTIFAYLCIAYGVNVKLASHIAGVDNGRCDDLSRLTSSGKSVGETMKKHKPRNAAEINIGEDATNHRFITNLFSNLFCQSV